MSRLRTLLVFALVMWLSVATSAGEAGRLCARGRADRGGATGTNGGAEQTPVGRLADAIAGGTLVWKLSTPEEVVACVGNPISRTEQREGGSMLLLLEYNGCTVVLARSTESSKPGPFTLIGYMRGETRVLVPDDYVPRLRTNEDLDRLNRFSGLQGVDLRALDLRNEGSRLADFSYDTRTMWPPRDSLPREFDPAAIIERGSNPGLGIRALHAAGIDGRGVAIAIIDQPLREDHEEYRRAVREVVSIDVDGFAPQMHGSLVAGFAVGKRLGTAPGADLHYFAVPMWKSTCVPFTKALEKIIEDNRSSGEPIRVVSISTGMFRELAGYSEWIETRERAEAAGILVLTCARGDSLPLCMLTRRGDGDPETPNGWRKGIYGEEGGLMVPAGGRTYAGVASKDCYVFDPEGGFSAVPPTLAGVCALALQVNPRLTPGDLRRGLTLTAWTTREGPVVNPPAFVEWARNQSGR